MSDVIPIALVNRGYLGLELRKGTDDRNPFLPPYENLPAGEAKGRVALVAPREGEKPCFLKAIDDCTDVPPVYRPRTHGAGFKGGVEGAFRKEFLRVVSGRPSHEGGFRMPGTVPFRQLDVPLLKED